MRAAIHTNYGPPDVVKIKEIARPIPKGNEVLIKVFVTTVNRTDCGFRSAEYFISRFFSGLFKPKYQTLGNEFAGEIVDIGKNVHLFKKGDRVFGFNDSRFGAHADYMILNENAAMAAIPDNMSYKNAAAICEGGHYALCAIRAAKVKNGQNVLVYGATGAIGSAAIQLLKYFKTNVKAVCDTNNVELVKNLGADRVIDYKKEDYKKIEQKFDFIFDAVGKISFGQCKHLLNKKGIYISTELGKNAENIYLALFTPLFAGKKVLFPIPAIKKKDVLFLRELAETNQYKPVIDRNYNLEQIVEAYKYVETGQKVGNVLLYIVENN